VSGALFVTGTDTGVGKTLVARALAAAFTARGLRVAPFKPFESGCGAGPAGLRPADALALRAACGLDEASLPLAACCLYAFAAPVAPGLAARRARVAVDLARVARAYAALRARFDLVLVEGAGGLLVPLAGDHLVADLAAACAAPLVVVGRAALGTINHTLLTLAEAHRRHLAVAGVVLSRRAPRPGPDDADNAPTIARLGGVPVLGTLPRLPAAAAATPARLAAAAAALDLDALLAAAALDPDALLAAARAPALTSRRRSARRSRRAPPR
jgi:dethiobiotin synthetase